MGDNKKRSKGRARLDRLLIDRGLVKDEKEAAAFVMAGKIIVDDQRAAKPGDLIKLDATVRVRQTSRYVSRGGEKLEGAVSDLGLAEIFRGKTVLDVGSSTGGFTDFCLQHGAAHVIAVDVGTNQLAWELRTNDRVTVLEQTDIRDYDPVKARPADIVVGDISFVALEKIAPAVVAAGGVSALHYILLVKPQFELAPEMVPPGGVVTDDHDRSRAVDAAVSAFERLGLKFAGTADSRLAGAAGNREVFVWFRRTPD